jgi:hypothetical protein
VFGYAEPLRPPHYGGPATMPMPALLTSLTDPERDRAQPSGARSTEPEATASAGLRASLRATLVGGRVAGLINRGASVPSAPRSERAA